MTNTSNVLKDQLHEQRRGLIKKVKSLRMKRKDLMGVPNTSKQWAELTTEIDSVSAQIDAINAALGIPVMVFDPVAGKMVEKGTGSPTGGLKRNEVQVFTAATDASKSVY
jgi:hypothetical protein